MTNFEKRSYFLMLHVIINSIKQKQSTPSAVHSKCSDIPTHRTRVSHASPQCYDRRRIDKLSKISRKDCQTKEEASVSLNQLSNSAATKVNEA